MTPPPSCTWLECGVCALVPWGVELTVLGCTFFSFSEELRANHKSAKASVQKLAAELKLSAKAAVAAKSSSNQAHAEYVPHEVVTSVGSPRCAGGSRPQDALCTCLSAWCLIHALELVGSPLFQEP